MSRTATAVLNNLPTSQRNRSRRLHLTETAVWVKNQTCKASCNCGITKNITIFKQIVVGTVNSVVGTPNQVESSTGASLNSLVDRFIFCRVFCRPCCFLLVCSEACHTPRQHRTPQTLNIAVALGCLQRVRLSECKASNQSSLSLCDKVRSSAESSSDLRTGERGLMGRHIELGGNIKDGSSSERHAMHGMLVQCKVGFIILYIYIYIYIFICVYIYIYIYIYIYVKGASTMNSYGASLHSGPL